MQRILTKEHRCIGARPMVIFGANFHFSASCQNIINFILLKIEPFTNSTSGNENNAKLLIENGANVNTRDKFGATPLHWSSRYGNRCTLIPKY